MINQLGADSSSHHAHDHVVKKLLSCSATARDVLNVYLPKEILAMTDLTHLELQRDSFIDDKHRAFAVDILYKAKLKNTEDGYIWFLIEHQRKSDHWLPERIFKYMGLVWDHIRQSEKAKHLPLVYPVIIYNGTVPYKHSVNLSDLVVPGKMREIFFDLFNKPFQLIDLANIADEHLSQHAQDNIRGMALLMAIKHVSDENLPSYFQHSYVEVLKKLDEAGGIEDVVNILYYLMREGNFPNLETFWDMVTKELPQKIGDKVMTIAEQLERKGREEGVAQGISQGISQGLVQGRAEGIIEGATQGKLEVAERLFFQQASLSDRDLVALAHSLTGLAEIQIKEHLKRFRQKH